MQDVIRIYSGKPGCMCGCQGKYYTPQDRGFKRVLNKFLANADFNDPKVLDKDNGWATVELDQRMYVAYFQ